MFMAFLHLTNSFGGGGDRGQPAIGLACNIALLNDSAENVCYPSFALLRNLILSVYHQWLCFFFQSDR